jgi:DnaJ-domain-containing protein 1
VALLALFLLAFLAAALWYASGHLHARQDPSPGLPEVDPVTYPFLASYFTLLIKVAQADGRIGMDELQFARRHLRRVARLSSAGGFSEVDLARLEEAILRRGHELTLDETAALVASTWRDLGGAEAFFEQALTALASIAALDGALDAREDAAVAGIARIFGISEARFSELRAEVVRELAPHVDPPASDDEANPFDQASASDAEKRRHFGAVLGLQGRLTKADVRRRYRELLALYHPDKVAHLGPELRALAERKTKEINEAYTWLARHHGL